MDGAVRPHFSQVRPDELLHVDSEGHHPVRRRAAQPAAFVIHSKVHESRPDVVGAVHAHGLQGKAFSSLHRLL
ncbi:class II aldolase/adducin family protein, partial [Rhodococcus hoagii]|nr:class II aldolase/adducin family protein [Prescottella equi]